jgi:DNA-binding GntR family transcriptional regulator
MSVSQLVRGLREQIADRLRDEILTGQFVGGEAVREADICNRFNVSRGPVREALQQLVHEGCLVGKPNCGVRVAPPLTEDVRQLLVDLRRMIENLALRKVFPHLTDEDFTAWHKILERIKAACEARDKSAMVREDLAWHRFLVERADPGDLLPVWLTVTNRAKRIWPRFSAQTTAEPMRLYTAHYEIVATIRAGDLEEAARKLEKNIRI